MTRIMKKMLQTDITKTQEPTKTAQAYDTNHNTTENSHVFVSYVNM